MSVVLLSLDYLTCTEQETRVDPVTGSTAHRTIGAFGITLLNREEISPIDARLKIMGKPHVPTWQYLCSNGHGMFFGRWCGCGATPEIYQMQPVLDNYAAASTDTELLAFVSVMQSGTSAKKRAAVDAARDKALAGI